MSHACHNAFDVTLSCVGRRRNEMGINTKYIYKNKHTFERNRTRRGDAISTITIRTTK